MTERIPKDTTPEAAPTTDGAATLDEQSGQIRLRLLRHAYSNFKSNVLVNLACGLGLYIQFHISGHNSALATALIAALMTLSLARAILSRREDRKLADDNIVDAALLSQAAKRYFWGMALACLLWGGLLHLAFQSGDSSLKFFAIIVVAAMAAGSTAVIAPLLKTGRFYISAFLGITLVELMTQPDAQHILSLLVGIFWAVMLVTHKRNHDILRNSIQLEIENQCLVSDLRVQKSALSDFNTNLEDRVKQRTRELKHLAEHDSLTRLYNRRGIIQWVNEHQEKIPDGQAFAVMFIDLDRFKQINDGMGHATGDCVLAEIGERLMYNAPDLCAFCRWGGDEFVGLLAVPEDLCTDIGLEFIEQLRAVIEKPIRFSNREVTVSFSAGLAVARAHPVAVGEAIRSAGLAAGEIKRNGRGDTMLYSKGLVEEQERTLVLAQRLKHALAGGEMHLAFQPLVHSDDYSIHSYEVLLRWDNPVLGRISPDEFIPIAEDIGEIVQIGAFVLDTALAAYAEQLGRSSHIKLALNISPRQLVVPGFAQGVMLHLEKHGLTPRMLILEVTETFIGARKQDKIIAVLKELHALGIEIHIDDFGTGYSSLSRLHDMPISVLKIDKSFVQDIDDQRRAIIEGSVMIAERFGVQTVAEGVESEEQADLLHAIGVTYLQGFLFGKPEPYFAEVTVKSDFLIWSRELRDKAS